MVLRKKLKGNTLPEVLIAICITAFCSTLAVTIYLNIQKSTMPFIILKGEQLANKCLRETLFTKNYLDGEFKEEGYTVKKTIHRSDKYPDCLFIKIMIFDPTNKQTNAIERTVRYE